jgi:hypothetical protein
LRAYCSRKEEEGCRWRLHASTIKGEKTVKVIATIIVVILLLVLLCNI